MRSILWILLILMIAFGAYVYFADVVEAPGTVRGERHPTVEEHVRQNISSLSPEPAVLGGTFYVTDIGAADGRGTVWYEDGHIALVADFTYVEDKYGVTIQSFEVREE